MSYVDDYDDYIDVSYDSVIEELIKGISKDNMQSYLGTYGDAVEERINACLSLAEELYKLNYYGSSITVSVTAIEIIIRFMLLRPLIQGAFLSDEWAGILTDRIATGRTAKDKELLPSVVKQLEIDITTVRLQNGQKLWDALSGTVWEKRNNFVHRGDPVVDGDALAGIECAKILMNEIVYPIAKKLGFTLDVTGKWSEISTKSANSSSESHYSPKSPFK